jgi:hypothetical protein
VVDAAPATVRTSNTATCGGTSASAPTSSSGGHSTRSRSNSTGVGAHSAITCVAARSAEVTTAAPLLRRRRVDHHRVVAATGDAGQLAVDPRRWHADGRKRPLGEL